MKRILILLLITIPALCFSQGKYTDNILYGKKENRTISFIAMGVPNDTANIASYPDSIKRKPHIAVKGNTLYLWDTTLYVWNSFAGGSGWSSVDGGFGLIEVNDSTLRVDTFAIVQWARLYKVADSLGVLFGNQKFGHASGDFRAGEHRYFSGAGIYNVDIDSARRFTVGYDPANGFEVFDYVTLTTTFSSNTTNGSRMFSQDGINNVAANNGRIMLFASTNDSILLSTSSGKVYMTNIPYSSSDGVVHLAIDTVASSPTFNKIVRKTAASGSDTHFGGNNLTQTANRTYTGAGFDYTFNGLGTWDFNVNTLKSFEVDFADGGDFQISSGNAFWRQRAGSFTSINGVVQLYSNTNGSSFTYSPNDSLGDHTFQVDGTDANNQFYVRMNNAADFARDSTYSEYWHKSTGFYFRPYLGNFYIDTLQQAAADYELFYDPTTGLVTYDEASAGGGVTSADLPLRITATTVSADTSVAYNPSLTSNQRVQKIIDSLQSEGWGAQSVQYEPWYNMYLDMSSNTAGGWTKSFSGAGASLSEIPGDIFLGWRFSQTMNTGTTSGGVAFHFTTGGADYSPISISSSYRYNYGVKCRIEDLADVTENYDYYTGFGDANNGLSNVVDGIYFRYNYADSSGVWIACTENNGTKTEDATDITVAADTDYELEISVVGGSAYFYIDKVLKATISTNIPDDDVARLTSMVNVMKKLAGTTARKIYIEWMAAGKRAN